MLKRSIRRFLHRVGTLLHPTDTGDAAKKPHPQRPAEKGATQKPADAGHSRHKDSAHPPRQTPAQVTGRTQPPAKKRRPHPEKPQEEKPVREKSRPPESPGAPPEEVAAFEELDLEKPILRALRDDLEFDQCTPIQGRALPWTLKQRDLAGQAQTGTGKTAAFLITIMQNYLRNGSADDSGKPLALILAPTRELALQIHSDAQDIGKYCNMRMTAVYGGMDYKKQRDKLQSGTDLLTATPGRLLD